MSDAKKHQGVNIDLAARAEAKLEVKAELPAASTGRLLDSLTDLIRPISEARGLKADLLRLQREEVAIEIAKLARQRIDIENAVIKPVPTKLLVPLFERGSCEALDDTEMIKRWADLLASAATGTEVHPRFVGILGELSGRQALCLETIAFGFAETVEYPYVKFVDAGPNYDPYWISAEVRRLVADTLTTRSKIDSTIDVLVASFSQPGCHLETITTWIGPEDEFYSWDGHPGTIINSSDLHVLASLGLIQQGRLDVETRLSGKKKGQADTSIFFYWLTELGVEFCQVCCREKVAWIRKLEARNRAKMGEGV